LWDPEPCFHLAINNSIYNNIVTCGTRTCATASSMGVSGFFENNTIDLNTYSVDAPGLSQWRLDDSSVTFESWQGRGFDQAGLVLTP
jgi:hypothetical protein